MKKSFRFVFFLAFPMMFGIISISESFVPLFFGEGYEKVVIIINVIAPTIVLNGIVNVVGVQFLLPTKRQTEYTMAIVAGLIVNFILNYILINLYGAIGAAIATIVSETVLVSVQLYEIRKDVNIREIIKLTYNYLLAGAIMFIVCMFIHALLKTSTVTIVVQIITGILVYILILAILKDEYLKMFIEKIKNIILKK